MCLLLKSNYCCTNCDVHSLAKTLFKTLSPGTHAVQGKPFGNCQEHMSNFLFHIFIFCEL